MNEHKCNCGKNHEKETYAFFSRVLNKPFDSVAELKAAEAKHFEEIKAKEDKAATKKADAKKVEDAFKALNAARRDYKENLLKLTSMYQEDLKKLKDNFESDKNRVHAALADAENNYSNALKAFTDTYDTYHLSLKDGDFETTLSGSRKEDSTASTESNRTYSSISELFDALFNF